MKSTADRQTTVTAIAGRYRDRLELAKRNWIRWTARAISLSLITPAPTFILSI